MKTSNQEDSQYLDRCKAFLKACRYREVPYPKFHIFDYVRIGKFGVNGYIISMRYISQSEVDIRDYGLKSWVYDVLPFQDAALKHVSEDQMRLIGKHDER